MKKSRKIVVLFWLAICILLVGGCAKSAASTSQLQNDLSEYKHCAGLLDSLDAKITGFEVVKRQTTEEDKLDLVWVRVDIASDAIKGKLYYRMTYNLYNDGWLLEEIVDDNISSWSFTPLRGAPKELVDRSLPGGAEIVSEEVDLKEGLHHITYRYVEERLYCDITHTRQCTLYFGADYSGFTSGRGEWGPGNDVELETLEDWRISGTWEGSYGTQTFVLTIDSFSPGNIAYQGKDSGEFLVSGTYEYVYSLFGLTLSDTDGLLTGKFHVSPYDGEVSYSITATGEYGETYTDYNDGGSKKYRILNDNASQSIKVTYDGLFYDLMHRIVELTKTS